MTITDFLRRLANAIENDSTDITITGHPYDTEILISCREAARLLGRTEKTVSMMLRDGRLSKVTIGRSTGIKLSDIRKFLPQ